MSLFGRKGILQVEWRECDWVFEEGSKSVWECAEGGDQQRVGQAGRELGRKGVIGRRDNRVWDL